MTFHVKCYFKKEEPFVLNKPLSLQDPYMFEPSCNMKVDEYGFFITWKSEGKVQPLHLVWHLKNTI